MERSDQEPAFPPSVRTLQCGHTVWKNTENCKHITAEIEILMEHSRSSHHHPCNTVAMGYLCAFWHTQEESLLQELSRSSRAINYILV